MLSHKSFFVTSFDICSFFSQPSGPGQPPHPVLKRCAQVLDPMTRAVPGLMEALYLLGKVKFLSGELSLRVVTFSRVQQRVGAIFGCQLEKQNIFRAVLDGNCCSVAGNVDAAQSTLQHCLDQDATYSDAHILMAQIHLHQNNFKLANQSLEVGLSYNFEVRLQQSQTALCGHIISCSSLSDQFESTGA